MLLCVRVCVYVFVYRVFYPLSGSMLGELTVVHHTRNISAYLDTTFLVTFGLCDATACSYCISEIRVGW
jgi:hypothetical protein